MAKYKILKVRRKNDEPCFLVILIFRDKFINSILGAEICLIQFEIVHETH